jgi:hypothetical protein
MVQLSRWYFLVACINDQSTWKQAIHWLRRGLRKTISAKHVLVTAEFRLIICQRNIHQGSRLLLTWAMAATGTVGYDWRIPWEQSTEFCSSKLITAYIGRLFEWFWRWRMITYKLHLKPHFNVHIRNHCHVSLSWHDGKTIQSGNVYTHTGYVFVMLLSRKYMPTVAHSLSSSHWTI